MDLIISILKEFNKIKHRISGVISIRVHIKVVYNFRKKNQSPKFNLRAIMILKLYSEKSLKMH